MINTKRRRWCEYCGAEFGSERGPAAKTCSTACEQARRNALEAQRYHRVKGTDEWKKTRADYVERMKAKAARDPAFAEQLRRNHRLAAQKYQQALNADPARREKYLAQKRQWHKDLDPDRRALRKQWYSSLDADQRRLYLLELRQQRSYLRLIDANAQAAPRRSWTDDEIALLGTMSDADVAKQIGYSRATVTLKRQTLKIAPKQGGSVLLSEKSYELMPELINLLLRRYRIAGLPLSDLEPWQVVEIALTELLVRERRKK